MLFHAVLRMAFRDTTLQRLDMRGLLNEWLCIHGQFISNKHDNPALVRPIYSLKLV